MIDDINLYDYDLPNELIANDPIDKRDSSRLLYVKRGNVYPPSLDFSSIQHKQFFELLDIIDDSYFLVLNNTNVVKARLNAKKITGGFVELLMIEEISREASTHNNSTIYQYKVMMRNLGKQKKIVATSNDGAIKLFEAGVTQNLDNGFYSIQFELQNGITPETIMGEYGQVPLPPYIKPSKTPELSRYQTVYNKSNELGYSVAAPTAGLHFTSDLINLLKARGVEILYVTLNVSAGTFLPIKTDKISEHKMHSETISITKEVAERINALKANGKKLLAVGSTSVRTLESVASLNTDGSNKIIEYTGKTDIFIKDDYKFKIVDCMITNFHLPKSTLLVMLASFCGREDILKAYDIAIKERYRFFSYGDAMLIL